MSNLILEVNKSYHSKSGAVEKIARVDSNNIYHSTGGNFYNCYGSRIDMTSDTHDLYIEQGDTMKFATTGYINIRNPIVPSQVEDVTLIPHKWAAELHAFADGHKIMSAVMNTNIWTIDEDPFWNNPTRIFKIKPALDDNIIQYIPIIDGVPSSKSSDTLKGLEKYFTTMADALVIRIEYNPNTKSVVSSEVVPL